MIIADFFSNLCTVTADMSELKKSIQPQTNRINGKHYYSFEFDIVILFGFTELKAQMAWMENVGRTFFLLVRSMSNAEKQGIERR